MEIVDRLIEIDDDVSSPENIKLQAWLVGYKFDEEGDLVVDDYAEFLGEFDTENAHEVMVLAIKYGSVRQTLATNSDVVMVQVQAVETDEDGNEECIDILYEAQVEFTRKK